MEYKIIHNDALSALKEFDDNHFDICVTSPPYFKTRDYGEEDQIGLNGSPESYVADLVIIFEEVYRTLKDTGSLWVNISDFYDNKSLTCVPFLLALEMRDTGWTLRNTIIWHKPNAMPFGAKSRFTQDFEYFFWFVKNKDRYYFETQYESAKASSIKNAEHKIKLRDERGGNLGYKDAARNLRGNKYNDSIDSGKYMEGIVESMRSKGRIKRTVWSIPTGTKGGIHVAAYPDELVSTPLAACCPPGGVVLDPFCGSGTTGMVAIEQGKSFVGIDISKRYCDYSRESIGLYAKLKGSTL